MFDDIPNIDLGRKAVKDGLLTKLREQTGLSRRAMSELLHTTPAKYTAWEENPDTSLWKSTAERIGAFYRAASRELELLSEEGVSLLDMVPFHLVATDLGIPQEVVMKMYREGDMVGHDLGVFGLWAEKQEVRRLSEAL